MEKITLEKHHIKITYDPRQLFGPVVILCGSEGNLAVFFNRTFFREVPIGWVSDYNEGYFGWHLYDKHDVKILKGNLNMIVANPQFLLTEICSLCINQIECILDNDCNPRYSNVR